jgi:hypothetical protein
MIFLASSKSVIGRFKWQTLKQPKLAQFDKVLYDRFIVVCCEGNPVTLPMIIERAKSKCTTQHSWLSHCATSHKVVGLIPDGVIGFLVDLILVRLHFGPGADSSSKTAVSTRSVFWGKGIQCKGLKLATFLCWLSKFWVCQPPGAVRACSGLCRDSSFKYFCDEMKITDKCTFFEGSNNKLSVRT